MITVYQDLQFAKRGKRRMAAWQSYYILSMYNCLTGVEPCVLAAGSTVGAALNSNVSIGASTAAAGTTTADAGALPAGTAAVYPTTGADGTKGVVINAADKVTGRKIFVGNGVSNAVLKVYPPSGGTINGASADAAFSSGSGKGCELVCLSGAGNTWLAW